MTTTTLRPSEFHDAVFMRPLPPVSPVDAGSASSTLLVLFVDSKTSTKLLPDVHDNNKPMISRKSVSDIKLGVMNCQSVCNKLDCITDHAEKNGLDIIAMMETWLSNMESRNKFVHDQCCANGYTLHHRPRNSGRKGDGVSDVNEGSLVLDLDNIDIFSVMVKEYDDSLSRVLDKHTPLKIMCVVERPMNDWITDNIMALKKIRRKHESIWRRTRFTIHFDLYMESCIICETAYH